GDLLAEIDQRQVSASLDQARAAAELAKSTYERYQNLIRENSVSRQEFEEVEARHRQAQAALEAAEVARRDAGIRAPYDGVITARMIDPGDMASPGTPLLAMEQEDAFCADLVLPENHIQAVSLNQQVSVSIPALGDAVLTGRVGRISPAADTRSRSFLVKVALPDDKRLKSGMFARVAIPVGEAGMLLVPESAVVVHGQLSGVYKVDADSVARFRLIRAGRQYGDRVEVISGIEEGDRYVTDPPPDLDDGDTVEVAP
ncbi:MAG: efflux RND transporter periplasmic adaptor subunit, partial [Thermodesulfobacteriota bacterium]